MIKKLCFAVFFTVVFWHFADIDECESGPCVNGDCVDGINHWECLCQPGWTGTACDIGMDDV